MALHYADTEATTTGFQRDDVLEWVTLENQVLTKRNVRFIVSDVAGAPFDLTLEG